MLSIKIMNATNEDIYEMCEALAGWGAFRDNEVIVTDAEDGEGCFLIIGPDNGHDCEVEAELV